MKTIAIIGAGPALGLAVARRFGREDFQVALVARGQGHLDTLTAELARDGVTAAGFPADFTDREATLAAVDSIEARFGPIDVLDYHPGGDGDWQRRAPEIDVANAAALLGVTILTPVALVRRVLPGMLERGDGALLFAQGGAAKYPVPHLASAGLAQAGLRNYVHTLHADLAPKNVYAGTLLIGALIEGSAAHRNAAAWADGDRSLPVVTAADLADHLWDMYLKRDRPEDEVTPGLSAHEVG
jgi:NADP-dependent 3-hydroxy acid dehydrogenase YdfG